tara:strand:- start:95 stop:1006 length:912 start_codon:yes stop_codon:yes gene_type:complete
MHVFGEIDKSSTTIESNVVNYTQNLSASLAGVQSVKIVKDSINTNYWNSLNVLFYTSGSPIYGNELKFTSPSSNLSIQPTHGKQFLTKYHGYPSSSIIQISSQYYGEKIKQGSFQFTDLNNTDNSSNNPIIKDDGFGNLYVTNANSNFGTLTASSAGTDNSISSSDNYVGNIFYDKGIAVITETGSWSGSVNYSDLGTNYNLKFDSVNTINTYEYNVTLLPQDFNLTTNYSIRNVLTTDTEPLKLSTPFMGAMFTSSNWQPYITQINLYQDGDYDTPIIQAVLPKPIRKSDKINTRFKIKLDI